MKYSLLKLTQTILSSMDADEINSISDSVEAQQVVDVIETVYNEIVSSADLPEHRTLFNLDPIGTSRPIVLAKPNTIDEMLWIKYNKRSLSDNKDNWGELKFLSPFEFTKLVQSFASSDSNVIPYDMSFESSQVRLYYKNNKAPEWWTSFDDSEIVCDSYDASIESNLQKSKTTAYGRKLITFIRSDTFVPNIDDQQFPLLINEAKALAWAEMKQAIHARAEKKARQGWISLQNRKYDTRPPKTALDRIPNYGRK